LFSPISRVFFAEKQWLDFRHQNNFCDVAHVRIARFIHFLTTVKGASCDGFKKREKGRETERQREVERQRDRVLLFF
jgi:hypothetical protein